MLRSTARGIVVSAAAISPVLASVVGSALTNPAFVLSLQGTPLESCLSLEVSDPTRLI
jgi:hypothetical protein